MIATDKQAFTRLLEIFDSAGGQVNEITTYMIQKSCQKNNITIEQAEKAIMHAYDNSRYITWAAVINSLRETNSVGIEAYL